MLRSIKTFFDKKIKPPRGVTTKKATEDSLRLSSAALLIEAMRADDNVSDEELHAMRAGLGKKFGTNAEETEALIRLAEEAAASAVSLYGFTSLINKGFEYDEKKEIIELLWEVVYADNILEKHEEHLVRRIADLLHVSHKDFIETKLSVKRNALKRGDER